MTVNASTAAVRADDSQIERNWLQRLFPLVFSTCYAGALAALPVDAFNDRVNYFAYLNYSDLILERYSAQGLVPLLANEPLWLLLNIALSKFLYPVEGLRVLIFVPAFLVSWQLLKRNPHHAVWLVLFLISPQVVKNHVIHLRQGMALGIFVLGYYAGPKWLRVALMLAAGLIHASFLFIAVIGVAVWASQALRISPRVRASILIACFIVIGALISVVAGTLGARQADYYADANLDITGLGFIFWTMIFFTFATAGAAFLKKNMFGFANLAFYLTIYFVTPVSGRIFESGMFMVFLAGLALPGQRRWVFLGAFTVYSAAQYVMRAGLPGLGWGIQ